MIISYLPAQCTVTEFFVKLFDLKNYVLFPKQGLARIKIVYTVNGIIVL